MREQRTFQVELVQKELQNCLSQARQRLHQFRQGKSQPLELLTECEGFLHQVQGSLQILNFTGAVVLVQEMEELVRALAENRALQDTSGFDLLNNAILFIPRYLDYVRSKQQEVSVLLLPTLNAFRRLRKVSILPEHTFVAFQLPDGNVPRAALVKAAAKSSVDPLFEMRIPRIRHMYQVGLIGIIRNTAVPTHLKYMNRAVDRLLQGSGNRPYAESWLLTSAILAAVGDAGLQLDNSVKQVLGLADRQIRKLKESGAGLLNAAIEKDVRDGMLYYLAKSVSEHPAVTKVQQHYQLAGLVANEHFLEQERKFLDAPDRALMAKVAAAIQVSMDYIKDRIDFLTGEGNLEEGTYEEVLRQMQQVVVHLQVLDLKHASKEIEEASSLFKVVYQEFRQACEKAGAAISIYEMADHQIRERVVEIASALLGIEVVVQSYLQGERRERHMSALGAAYNDARKTVLKESRSILDLVKQAIGAFIDPYSDRRLDATVLEEVPAMLQSLRGIMFVLQKDRVVRLLEILEGYLRENLMRGPVVDIESREDALADVVSSLEFYLEAFEQYQQADDGLLDVASEALQELGCARI